MLYSNPNTPLYDMKGDNVFTIQMNSDQSESSTGDSNPIGDIPKSKEDNILNKNLPNNKFGKNQNKKKVPKSKNLLNKKTKRNNSKPIKTSKFKIIINIFNEFKSSSSLYQKFSQFHYIEKNVKNELYSSAWDFAKDVRNIFSNIFSSILNKLDYTEYNKALALCENFEKIYNKYDTKPIAKKCKVLNEESNKLKKEIHKIEMAKNGGKPRLNSSKNCEIKNENEMNRYKDDILCKIKKLNNEQKKGILEIVSNNYINKYKENNIIEFNINKIPFNQLKELDNYINKCINNNNINQMEEFSIISAQKENTYSNFDDMSSCLSDESENDDLD
jgi:hypothetical protein